MITLEEEIQQDHFANEQIKANLNIQFTSNWLHNKTSAKLKLYNTTPEQFNVLRILRGKHPETICQKDILSRMTARQSNLTLIIKKLKEKKLIVVNKSETDRRQYIISIEATGLALLSKIDSEVKLDEDVSKLTDGDARLLNSLLDKLRAN